MSYDGGQITPIQIFFMTIGFLYGTSSILARVGPAEQDSWLVALFAGGMGFLYLLMYLAILKRFPGQTLIEIARTALGNVGGTIFGLLFFWYSLHLSALVVRNISELLSSSYMPETPMVFFTLAMLIITSVAVRSGIETIARTSEISLISGLILVPFSITILAIANGLFFPSRLLPILNHDVKTMAFATQIQTAFPFGEMVILTMVLGLANDFARGTRAVLWSNFFATLMGIVILTREIAVLGTPYASRIVFPSLITTKLVHLGEFFPHMEVLFLVTWIVATFIKLSLCQYAATVSLGQIMGFRDYRPLTLPIAGLTGGLSVLLYDNILQMIGFIPVYGLYALPFQVILPLILLIAARRKPPSHAYRTGSPGG